MDTSRPTPRRRPRAGFTLAELMGVVAIIAVTAAIAVPGMQAATRERETVAALGDALAVIRGAQAEAYSTGRAHLVRYISATKTLSVWKGRYPQCRLNPWNTDIIPAAYYGNSSKPTCGAGGSYCVDYLSLNGSDVTMTAKLGDLSTTYTQLDICYEPLGRMGWVGDHSGKSTNPTFAHSTATGGGFVLEFQQTEEGSSTTASGVKRYLAIPFGGAAARRVSTPASKIETATGSSPITS